LGSQVTRLAIIDKQDIGMKLLGKDYGFLLARFQRG
jgi:hypothetical protein